MSFVHPRPEQGDYRFDNHRGPRAHHEAPPDAHPPRWPARAWALLQRLAHRLGFVTGRRTG